jgi:hypothetical protein
MCRCANEERQLIADEMMHDLKSAASEKFAGNKY